MSSSPQAEPLRLGLITSGSPADGALMEAAARAASSRVVATTASGGRRRKAPEDVEVYDEETALLSAADVEAVVVSGWFGARLALARHCAHAGLPALIQSPAVVDAPSALALADLHPAPYVIARRRFEQSLLDLRAALPERRGLRFELDMRTFGRRASTAEDALLALGPDMVDLVRWLTGAVVTRVRAPILQAKRAQLELDMFGAHATLTMRTDDVARERIVVRDAEGGSVANWSTGGAVGGRRMRRDSLVDSLTTQLEAFAAALRHEPGHGCLAARDAVATFSVLDAARRSASAAGAWQAVVLPAV